MKTNTDSENQTTDTRPDYEIARDTLRAAFSALNLAPVVFGPLPEVQDGWPCISYTVSVKGETFSYSLGIGHVKWGQAAIPPSMRYSDSVMRMIELTRRHAAFREDCREECLRQQASIAAELAKHQKVSPNPAEVLASAAREGQDADQSFESWCSDFGYDTDSMKARACYDACTEDGKKARRVLGAENARKFAELSAQL